MADEFTTRSFGFKESFPHIWHAEVIEQPPLIAPARQFFYPKFVDEVELGALQLIVTPRPGLPQFMATFALGFADSSLPHGVWACPNPEQLCAVAGGYAYVLHAANPEQWMQIPYKPVTAICPIPTGPATHFAIEPTPRRGLLVFASFHTLYALGVDGLVWETGKLSWEGVRITQIENGHLYGFGWDFHSDREVPFKVDLRDGSHEGGSAPSF